MTERMLLLMAQVDDVPGELMGEFIRQAERLGVRNIQVVASITKKGRPGYMVYIDIPASLESETAILLGSELGTWGYRILAAEHKHFNIERSTIPLCVSVAGSTHRFEIRTKTISEPGKFKRIKAEHDDLTKICEQLREKGHRFPLVALKAETESQLSRSEPPDEITITF